MERAAQSFGAVSACRIIHFPSLSYHSLSGSSTHYYSFLRQRAGSLFPPTGGRGICPRRTGALCGRRTLSLPKKGSKERPREGGPPLWTPPIAPFSASGAGAGLCGRPFLRQSRGAPYRWPSEGRQGRRPVRGGHRWFGPHRYAWRLRRWKSIPYGYGPSEGIGGVQRGGPPPLAFFFFPPFLFLTLRKRNGAPAEQAARPARAYPPSRPVGGKLSGNRKRTGQSIRSARSHFSLCVF